PPPQRRCPGCVRIPRAGRPRRLARRRSSLPGTTRMAAARWGRTTGSASAGAFAECLRRLPGNLVRRHVAEVLVDGPAMTERVDELAGVFAPERLMQRPENFGPGPPGPLPPRPRARAPPAPPPQQAAPHPRAAE